MLNYEICKILKEKGFRQILENGYYHGKDFPAENSYEHSDYCSNGIYEDSIACPTLSDLIEACGFGFFQLKRFGKQWKAYGCIKSNKLYSYGDLPEKAVANLWLELNKK